VVLEPARTPPVSGCVCISSRSASFCQTPRATPHTSPCRAAQPPPHLPFCSHRYVTDGPASPPFNRGPWRASSTTTVADETSGRRPTASRGIPVELMGGVRPIREIPAAVGHGGPLRWPRRWRERGGLCEVTGGRAENRIGTQSGLF